ncbi:MAG: V-type ATPase subunit subunit G family protein [Deinococcales bacterium]
MEAQGEKLLQDLIKHEQSLLAKVEESKSQATKLIEAAKAEAENLLKEAKSKAEALAKAQVEKTQAEGEHVRKAILDEAQKVAADVAASAKQHRDKAIKLVMERLLP